MIKQLKLKHLQCSFLRLTENNQVYILGLIEGLKHAQGKGDKKLIIERKLKEKRERKVYEN